MQVSINTKMICKWVRTGNTHPKMVAKWINATDLESSPKNKSYVTKYKNNLNTDHLKVYQSSTDQEKVCV